ncbi:LOW QUALITY PROTEIN: hypothetical protein ACHAXS_007935 [Conticribra weissflogii]
MTSAPSLATASNAPAWVSVIPLVLLTAFFQPYTTATLADTLAWGANFSVEQHHNQVKASRVAMQMGREWEETTFLAALAKGDREVENCIKMACASMAHSVALVPQWHHTAPTQVLRCTPDLEWQKATGFESTCDGCSGLVSWQHEAAKYEWIALFQLAYRQCCVGNEPKIFNGCGISSSAAATITNLSTPKTSLCPGGEARGNIFVDGFWKTNYTCIFDVHITNVHKKLH